MGSTRRAALVALAGLTVAGLLLTACASGTRGTGTLRAAPAGSAGAGPLGGGAPSAGTPTHGPGGGTGVGTGTGGGGNGHTGGGSGGGGTGGGGAGLGSPSPQPSASSPGGTIVHVVKPNYSVKATGNCSWIMDKAGHITIYAELTISYVGIIPPDWVPYIVSDDLDSLGSDNVNHGPLPSTFNGELTDINDAFAGSKWPGHTVKVQMKIFPQTTDTDATDNLAWVRVQVPANEPAADLLNPLPCTPV